MSGLSLVFTLASVGSKYFWVLEAVIFGTLLPEHPAVNSEKTFGYVKVHFMRDENTFSLHMFNNSWMIVR